MKEFAEYTKGQNQGHKVKIAETTAKKPNEVSILWGRLFLRELMSIGYDMDTINPYFESYNKFNIAQARFKDIEKINLMDTMIAETDDKILTDSSKLQERVIDKGLAHKIVFNGLPALFVNEDDIAEIKKLAQEYKGVSVSFENYLELRMKKYIDECNTENLDDELQEFLNQTVRRMLTTTDMVVSKDLRELTAHDLKSILEVIKEAKRGTLSEENL